jgi:hypothetical protein
MFERESVVKPEDERKKWDVATKVWYVIERDGFGVLRQIF